MLRKLFTLIALSLMSFNAHSFIVFSTKPIDWDKIREVDMFIAGEGPEMGGLFALSAITSARYKQVNSPDYRAQVIFWVEEDLWMSQEKYVRDRGFHVISSNRSQLTLDYIERQIRSFPSISSLSIYSHSSTARGITVQSGDDRLDHRNIDWRGLRSKFTDDSYIYLYGCNNGYEHAPRISRAVERPVFGSFTGTDFQEIYTDGNWYHHNSGQYPSGMSKLTWIESLYDQRLACWRGYCQRMKPNNHPYRGLWGRYETGLPYHRPFCNYGANTANNMTSDCSAGIAQAMRAWPVPQSYSDRERVIDFVCPRNPGHSTRQRCINYLNGTSNQSIFWGNTLKCNLQGCDFNTRTVRDSGRNLTIYSSSDYGNAAFRDAYNLFMSALRSN